MAFLISALFTLFPAHADSIKKIESPVVEGLSFYQLTSSAHPYGIHLDAKGGKRVFDRCGSMTLVEGKHYTLSTATSYYAQLPGFGTGTGLYYKIQPGPDCK